MNLSLTGIAAERYRRAQGKWPAQLADLVPDYLPAVPLDPFSGLALQSKTASNKFLAYSVGVQAPFTDAEDALIGLKIQRPPQ